MPLDPRAQRLLHMLSASADTGKPETAEDRRRSLSSLTAAVGGVAPDVASIETHAALGPRGPIPLRLYRPMNAGSGAIVFLHGGGWVAGDLDTHDGVCRRLASASGCAVFAVHYRLAPEHPFPAGLDDAVAAIDWIAASAAQFGIDPERLAVAGDSAGGNLAAGACLLRRDAGRPPLKLLLLICPILDLASQSASRLAFAEGYFLSQATMDRDLADYLLKGAALDDPRLSPLQASDLSGLPPTQAHMAEFDPFRDEGLAFADRLAEAGAPVTKTLHPGMIHYFYAMPGALPYAETALAEIGAAVRTALDA